MRRVDELRERAEFCERHAAQAQDPAVRQQFLALARQWRELSQSAEILEWKNRAKDPQDPLTGATEVSGQSSQPTDGQGSPA